jgi:hypothetical protein
MMSIDIHTIYVPIYVDAFHMWTAVWLLLKEEDDDDDDDDDNREAEKIPETVNLQLSHVHTHTHTQTRQSTVAR